MTQEIIDFMMYANERGLRFRIRGGLLLVSPKEKLLPADADFIRANKEALLREAPLWPGPCPGVCPGATNELCCGCPDVQTDYLMPGGLIRYSGCLEAIDVAEATHWRNRGDVEWIKVGGEAAA